MKSTEVFKVGNLNIGHIDSDFESRVGGDVEEKELGSFKVLGEYMENAQAIEDKLNPGKCTLGDVYAFLKNPPEGTKDGRFNLFLVGDYVVSVRWRSFDGAWRVRTWGREDDWNSENRVFSPILFFFFRLLLAGSFCLSILLPASYLLRYVLYLF